MSSVARFDDLESVLLGDGWLGVQGTPLQGFAAHDLQLDATNARNEPGEQGQTSVMIDQTNNPAAAPSGQYVDPRMTMLDYAGDTFVDVNLGGNNLMEIDISMHETRDDAPEAMNLGINEESQTASNDSPTQLPMNSQQSGDSQVTSADGRIVTPESEGNNSAQVEPTGINTEVDGIAFLGGITMTDNFTTFWETAALEDVEPQVAMAFERSVSSRHPTQPAVAPQESALSNHPTQPPVVSQSFALANHPTQPPVVPQSFALANHPTQPPVVPQSFALANHSTQPPVVPQSFALANHPTQPPVVPQSFASANQPPVVSHAPVGSCAAFPTPLQSPMGQGFMTMIDGVTNGTPSGNFHFTPNHAGNSVFNGYTIGQPVSYQHADVFQHTRPPHPSAVIQPGGMGPATIPPHFHPPPAFSAPQGAFVPGTQQHIGLPYHAQHQNGYIHPVASNTAAAYQIQNGQPGMQPLPPHGWQMGPGVLNNCPPRQGAPGNMISSPHSTPSLSSTSSAGRRPETFHVLFDYRPLPPSRWMGRVKPAEMYVEKHVPLEPKREHPIVLVHGDHHTGHIWTTKPDGGQGWASAFVSMGFTVYIVDLPGCGRSSRFHRTVVEWSQFADDKKFLDRNTAQATLTAAGKCVPLRWPRADKHVQWPGTGLGGDEIFEKYMASTVPVYFRRHQRQAIGKEALTKLVDQIGPAILLGQGSGANLCWLAADALPNSVKAVLAVEPFGPPGGTNRVMNSNGSGWRFSDEVRRFPNHRPYGLTDIPLTFDPPVPEPEFNEHGVTEAPLNLLPTIVGSSHVVHLLQRSGPELVQGDVDGRLLPSDAETETPRKLVALSKMPQLVVTGEASFHTTFDAATVGFMEQAGVHVDHMKLGDMGICGNGHLMFLEKNSDDVASALCHWMEAKMADMHPSGAAAEGSAATQ